MTWLLSFVSTYSQSYFPYLYRQISDFPHEISSAKKSPKRKEREREKREIEKEKKVTERERKRRERKRKEEDWTVVLKLKTIGETFAVSLPNGRGKRTKSACDGTKGRPPTLRRGRESAWIPYRG